jgi:hypothetical protein
MIVINASFRDEYTPPPGGADDVGDFEGSSRSR